MLTDKAGTPKALTHNALVKGIKLFIQYIGLDASRYSSHSLRRGGATFAFLSGIPAELIKAQGDWRSDAYQRYRQISDRQKCMVGQAMHAAMSKGMFTGNLSSESP
jgi:hypothetical protein